MDADAFLQQVRPGSQRSRLAPFLAEIRKLRDAGCTLEQVVEFLAKNGYMDAPNKPSPHSLLPRR